MASAFSTSHKYSQLPKRAGSTARKSGDSKADPNHGYRQRALGSTSDPRVTPQTRIRYFGSEPFPDSCREGTRRLRKRGKRFCTGQFKAVHSTSEHIEIVGLDPLTTLFNRRYMEESLERELHRARRNHSSVAVVMLDVDHFKRFNDTYGHRAADKMLCLLSRCLQATVRSDDIVCRYGGEEFVLILPSSKLDETMMRTRQLQEGIRQLRLETGVIQAGNVSVSAGIAIFPVHGEDSETLLSIADRALYDAKRAGRDRMAVGRPAVQIE